MHLGQFRVGIMMPIWRREVVFTPSSLLVLSWAFVFLGIRHILVLEPLLFTRSSLQFQVLSRFFFNTYTSAYRIEVEHDIGNLYMEWAILQREQNLSTEKPAAWFQAAVLMHNIRIRLYHNSQTAIRFGMPPPSLEEYLPAHH